MIGRPKEENFQGEEATYFFLQESPAFSTDTGKCFRQVWKNENVNTLFVGTLRPL